MPGPESPPGRVGSEAGGFRLSNSAKEFRVEAWGYWTPDVISAFRRLSPVAARKLSALGAFVFDAKKQKPQGLDGQEALRELFRMMAALPFTKGSVLAENALARMQLTRLVRDADLAERVGFE